MHRQSKQPLPSVNQRSGVMVWPIACFKEYRQLRHHLQILIIGMLPLFTLACQPLIVESTVIPPAQSVTPLPTYTVEPEQEQLMSPDLRAIPQVAQAIADLAARLQIDEETIDVVRVEEVEWPDSSVGCPQPDMMYLQVLTNGSFIQLQVEEQLYNYHSRGGRDPLLCTSKDEVLPEDLPSQLRGDPNI